MTSDRRKKDELTEEEKILKEARQKQQLVAQERNRVAHFRSQHGAALCIQRAWKMFKFKTQGILKNARDAIKLKRLDAGELEWKKQIAACTIQLAWRKYYRQKLLKALNQTNNKVMHMWDLDVVSTRQKKLVEEIYSEQLYAPEWHPVLAAPTRPYWSKYMPSPAALSFNFAIEQYTQPKDLTHYMSQSTDNIDDLDLEIQQDLAKLRLAENASAGSKHYSYNLSR